MYGAILGDMIGAPYEFDMGGKTKDFPLFERRSQFTDDSVMTIAVAQALLDTLGQNSDLIKATLVRSMQLWGRKYPYAGYGGMFRCWLTENDPQPYNSFGNGSAMRVSSAGWLYDTLDETRHVARLTAEVTHNHPEGIKGAEAAASAIFLARSGKGKKEIRDYITSEFGYDLIMLRAVSRRFPRRSQLSLRATISRTLSARRFHSAETATPLPALREKLPRRTTVFPTS